MSENYINVKGKETIVDADDLDLENVCWRWVGDYVGRTVNRKTVFMHRVILERKLGRELIPGEIPDHINCNPEDNRRENLRVANHYQSLQNRRTPQSNTTGYKGVYLSKDKNRKLKWQALIRVNGVRKHLGRFATAEEAYIAYCKAAKQYQGEFARFN